MNNEPFTSGPSAGEVSGRVELRVAPLGEVVAETHGSVGWLSGVLVFLIGWILFSSGLIRHWQTDWSYGRACYFTVINVTTVGFGDVVPTTRPGKVPNPTPPLTSGVRHVT